MQGSGLNFTQGHYNDPMAGIQQSLGAGGIFAKTLSNMQQFDQDEAKLQMMRQDRERQAKLDAESKAEKDALKAEKAANTGLRSALFDGQIKDAAASLGYEDLSVSDKAAIDLRSDYAGLNVSNANTQNKSYIDQLSKSGVKAGDSLFDDLSYRVANYKDGDKYDGTLQVATAKDVYRKLGMDDKKALSLASKDYGVSESDAADMLKRNSLQASLGKKANDMSTAASYQETDSKIVHDYISKVKASGGLVTDGMLDSAHESRKNDIAALADHQKLLDSYNEKLAAKQGEKEDKQLAANIEMTKMKMQHLESGLRLLTGRGSSSDDDGLNSKTVKHTYETEALNAVYSTLKGITNSGHAKNASAVREATVMADEMIKNGASPAQIQNTLRASLLGQNDGEKSDAFNKLKFQAVGGYEKLRASPEDMARYEYSGGKSSNTASSAAYKAEADSSLALLKQMASGGTAAIDAQIGSLNKKVAELNRTPGQAMKDTASHDVHQWAVENGLSGAVAEETARDNIYKSTHKDTPAEKAVKDNSGHSSSIGKLYSQDARPITPESGQNGPLSNFSLNPKYNSMNDAQRKDELKYQSFKIIDSREGTKKDPYTVYNDSLGKPTTGTGILVAGLNSYLGHKYDPKSIKDRDALVTYSGIKKEEALSSAHSQAAELGFSADAIPILASVNYQLGSGWKNEFKQSYSMLKKGDYDGAIRNLKDSKWNGQTKNRVDDFIAAIEQQKAFKSAGQLDNVQKFYNTNANSIDSFKSKIGRDINTYSALAKENQTANDSTNAFRHPIKAFGYLAETSRAEDKVKIANDALSYLNDASIVKKLKLDISKLPKNIDAISPTKQVAAQKILDSYDDAMKRLRQYEANNNTIGQMSYAEQNGIPLYSALYDGK